MTVTEDVWYQTLYDFGARFVTPSVNSDTKFLLKLLQYQKVGRVAREIELSDIPHTEIVEADIN
jgi:hypothetical protein